MSLNTWGMPYNLGALDKEVREKHEVHTLDTLYTVSREPQCLSLRPNRDPPPPFPQASVCPPPEPKGGRGHTRLRRRGWVVTVFHGENSFLGTIMIENDRKS
jgi:hypothetical protein